MKLYLQTTSSMFDELRFAKQYVEAVASLGEICCLNTIDWLR